MAKQQAEETKGKPGGIPHIVGSVIGILLIIVLLPLFVCNMTLIIKSFVKPEKVPTVFGVAPLIVESGSMKDAILVNDLIFVKAVDAGALQVKDVIAFQPPEEGKKVVTHRIVEITEENGVRLFTTKGDNNNTVDQDPVASMQVVGRYFARIPRVGKAAQFLQTPLGMITCVGVPLIAFLTYDVLRRVLYNRKKTEEDSADKEELERLRALAASIEMGEFPAQAAAEAPRAEAPEERKLDVVYPPVEGEDQA